VDGASFLLVLEHVDVAASGHVIGRRVRPVTAHTAATLSRLCDVTLPPLRRAADVTGDISLQLEPACVRRRTVHVDVQQPVMITISSAKTNFIRRREHVSHIIKPNKRLLLTVSIVEQTPK